MWIVVPIKRFDLAKSRLSNRFAPSQRADLAQSLASIALRAALDARGTQRVLALTADPAARQLCTRLGVEVLDEPPGAPDLNTLIGGAFDTLERRGGPECLVYLASDLPQLTAASIEQLRAEFNGSVGVGRAARDGGTNALIYSPPRRFALAFGPDSARRHCANARAAGLEVRVHDIPGISYDLDLPEQAGRMPTLGVAGGAA